MDPPAYSPLYHSNLAIEAGRNAFQRSKADALALFGRMMDISSGPR